MADSVPAPQSRRNLRSIIACYRAAVDGMTGAPDSYLLSDFAQRGAVVRSTPLLPRRARIIKIVYNRQILPGLACRGSARRHFCQQRSPGQTT